MKHGKFESLIESYLTGTLADIEKEEFENHYFECDRCFARLKVHENLLEKKVIFSHNPAEKKVLFPIFKPAAVFATLIFVFLTSFYIINENKIQKKFDSVSKFSPPVFITAETRSINDNGIFLSALEKYNDRLYKEAFKIVSGYDTSSSKIIFFRGILQLLNEDPKKAIVDFDKIINEMNPSYFDQAIYYKSLALLKLREKEKAVKELQKLTKMFSPFKAKARILLEKIDKI